MGATVGRCKVDSMSLSGCAWVERISLCNVCLTGTFIPQCRRKKRKSNLSAVDGFSSCDDVLFYRFELFCDRQCLQPCVFAMWYAHNRDAEAAAAALTDNAASLLFWWCCLFFCVFLCVHMCVLKLCWNTVRHWESSLPLPDVCGGASLINVLIGRELMITFAHFDLLSRFPVQV